MLNLVQMITVDTEVFIVTEIKNAGKGLLN